MMVVKHQSKIRNRSPTGFRCHGREGCSSIFRPRQTFEPWRPVDGDVINAEEGTPLNWNIILHAS